MGQSKKSKTFRQRTNFEIKLDDPPREGAKRPSPDGKQKIAWLVVVGVLATAAAVGFGVTRQRIAQPAATTTPPVSHHAHSPANPSPPAESASAGKPGA